MLSARSLAGTPAPPKEVSMLDSGASGLWASARTSGLATGYEVASLLSVGSPCECPVALPTLHSGLVLLFDFYGLLFCLKAMLCYVILRLRMPGTLPTSFPGISICF